MKVLLDTSVLVAAMVESHPMHGRAHPCLDRGIAGEFEWVVGAHSLAELYHVLTAYPVRPRIAPGIARQLIHENIAKKASVVALTAADYAAVIQHVAMLNLTGGVIYDALILRAAERAGVDRVLTFNVDDFRRLWPDGAAKIAAPQDAPSMRAALSDLKLDNLELVHAGDGTFPLTNRIRAVALSDLLDVLQPLRA